MKVKILCEKKEYDFFSNLLKDKGIKESENPTHVIYDVRLLNKKITIKTINNEMVFIDKNDILIIESFGNIIEIRTNKTVYKTRQRLSSFVDPRCSNLIQINKSQLVSINHIMKIKPLVNSKLQLVLDNGDVEYVSRAYKEKFRMKIMNREK